MLNDTQSTLNKAPYAPREGVFIPRKQVQKMRRASGLLDEARRRARDLIKDAQQQAAELRRQAFASGYEDGALAAASHVLSHFDATQALAQRMRGELEQHARSLLGAALDHPDTVLALLDQCLQGLAGPPQQGLRISLPLAMRGVRPRLNAMLEQAGRSGVEIVYRDDGNDGDGSDDRRLVVLAGEQVFEFDPPASAAQGQRDLLSRFPDLAGDCRGLGDEAMQRWREAFEQDFAQQDFEQKDFEQDDEAEFEADSSAGDEDGDGDYADEYGDEDDEDDDRDDAYSDEPDIDLEHFEFGK
jgi:hypothetical protein